MSHNSEKVNSKDLYKPRNDLVLIQMQDIGSSKGGVVIPEISAEGKQYIVVAMGAKVEELSIGDRVLVVGRVGIDWDFLPMHKDLFICKQQCVALIYRE